ncbi:MAG: condensation domain-containing protein [Candidatus Aminicenantes bacterium]|jgi:amino acid adenylation domain-containing protein
MNRGNFSKSLIIAAGQRLKERDYWGQKLSGNLLKSSFPYDYEKKETLKFMLDEVKFKIEGELFQRLMELAKNSDYTLHIILITSLVVLLEKYSNNKDIIVSTPIYKQQIEGKLINSVIFIRNQLKEGMTFKDLLFQVKQTVAEAIENQNYPIQLFPDQLKVPLSKGGRPLFDVSIVLENIHDKSYLQPVAPNMIFSFLRNHDHMMGTIEYNQLLYKKVTIELLMNHFQQLFQTVILDFDIGIAHINILTDEEKNKILYEFNHVEEPFPTTRTIHELFEMQSEKSPDGTALVDGNRQLTYDTLNKKTNQLAHLLRKKGIKADGIVGIMVERTLEMIVGILGILKAGGAYLPLEPNSPKKRILYMLEECQVSILITQENIFTKYTFTVLQDRRTAKEEIYVTPKRQQIIDLDKIPIPNRSLVDYEIYNRQIGQAMFKNCTSIQASRGCPYHCLYCHKIWPKKHVFRSAQHIFEEVLLYYKLGVRRFAFIDDIFNLDKKNSSRFFQLVIQNKLNIEIAFPNGIRGDLLTKDYIDLMVEAGTRILAFALETASPRLQKLLGKNLNLEKFRENIEYYCEKYPQVILELFTMHGFPSETREEAMMTLNFIKSLKWLHFPFVFVLKIYPNTDMAEFAMQHGISFEQIQKSDDLLYNELPETLPFEKSFTLKYQGDFLNNYFLLKERLLFVLPHQMNLLSEDEIVQAYNGYLPNDILTFPELLDNLGVPREDLGGKRGRDDSIMYVHNIQEKMRKCFPTKEPDKNALRILLLDVSQFFSEKRDIFYDVIEPPLGLMYLMTYLKQEFGSQINGKVIKSRIDFDNYEGLKRILGDFKADVIGIRSLSSFKDFFHKTVAMIRHWGIDVPIIAGGPYATSSFQTILHDRNIDLVVLGEGEVTFNEIIGKIIENNGKLPDEEILKEINGIAFTPAESGQERRTREILILDELTNLVQEYPDENLTAANDSKNLAYSIFTSGSTGQPKGVPITHANLSPLLHWGYKNLHLSTKQRVVQNLAYFFDWSVWEIFMALTSGANLHMVRKEILLDAEAYLNFIKKNVITVLHITPTQWQSLIAPGQKLETLTYLCIGAEKLSGDLLRRSFKLVDRNCRIFNMYGPTEATIITAILEIDSSDKEKYQSISSVPIGKPVANAEMFVLDENLSLCPINLKGELYIAGDCLARGYLNEMGRTSKKFIKNVLPGINGKQLYRTGDIVRWLPDGTLEFLEREDHQVKIRGFRIELGEIQSRLLKHDKIKEVLVTAGEFNNGKGTGDKYICAYIVSDNELDPNELRNYLSMDLPDYMIPSQFIFIEKVPLTLNGKVNWKALSSIPMEKPANYQGPRDDTEVKLVKLWSEVLNKDKNIISIDDDFFELGGHSLKATQLVSGIRKTLNTKIALQEIFTVPSIRGLAEYIKGTAVDQYVPLQPVEKKEYYALSSAQKRLYILQQMYPELSHYNIPIMVELEGKIRKSKIEDILKKLIKRHESLRTSFEVINEENAQKIHEEIDFNIHSSEVNASSPTQWPTSLRNFIRPFDLSQPPLLRVGLIKIEEERHVLVMDMHHVITDGNSMGVLVKELMTLYEGKELPAQRIQYKDFTCWQNRWIKSGKMKAQEAYWLKQFETEIPVVNLPTDYPRSAEQSFEGDHILFTLDKEETSGLNKLVLEQEATLFMVLLAQFNILISKLVGREEILTGTITAGRTHGDLEPVIGMFVNILTLKSSPRGEKKFAGFLKEIKETALQAFDNQDYPFEMLVEKLGVSYDRSRHPLVDTGIGLQNLDMEDIVIPELTLKPIEYENKTSKWDLSFYATEHIEKIDFLVEYRTKLFKRETVELFIKYFKEIIKQTTRDSNVKLKDIRISHGFFNEKLNNPDIKFGF